MPISFRRRQNYFIVSSSSSIFFIPFWCSASAASSAAWHSFATQLPMLEIIDLCIPLQLHQPHPSPPLFFLADEISQIFVVRLVINVLELRLLGTYCTMHNDNISKGNRVERERKRDKIAIFIQTNDCMRNILHTVVFKLKGYYLCLLILWLLNYCLSRNFWVFFSRFSRAEMKEVRARQCPLGLHIAPHIKCRGFHPAAPKHSHTHKFCMSFSFAAAAAAVAWKHAVQTKEVGEQRGTMRAPNQCDNSRQMAINNFSFFGWHFRSRGCCRQLLAPLRAHTQRTQIVVSQTKMIRQCLFVPLACLISIFPFDGRGGNGSICRVCRLQFTPRLQSTAILWMW